MSAELTVKRSLVPLKSRRKNEEGREGRRQTRQKAPRSAMTILMRIPLGRASHWVLERNGSSHCRTAHCPVRFRRSMPATAVRPPAPALRTSGGQLPGSDKIDRGMKSATSGRRGFLKTAGAAFTTSIFTANVRGANDRLVGAYIGTGRMGLANIRHSRRAGDIVQKYVCDVYEPNLEKAVDATGGKAKPVHDFREILADPEVDFVCIATPDHWHAYMTVGACKAGKDVYVEKPISTTVEEGVKMVQAARKYKRVVQAGTMQRSGLHFQQAVNMVKSGLLGKITFCRTWNYSNMEQAGIGNPPDSDPPPGLDWDMWLPPVQQEPLRRRSEALLFLPLLLGLRRRDDDGLGRPPARHRPMGF